MSYVSASMRREAIERAGNCCEYCLVNQEDRSLPYELDHIIAEKHGGDKTLDNLCWSCYICNGYKGSDIASIDWEGSGGIAPLFHPRRQTWGEHFQLNDPIFGMMVNRAPPSIIWLASVAGIQRSGAAIAVPCTWLHHPCTIFIYGGSSHSS